MSRHLITATLVAASVAASGCMSDRYYGDARAPGGQYYSGGCYRGERAYDCRERLRYEQQTSQRYAWRDGRYERQDATGAVVAGAIIGFILGAAIVGSDDDRRNFDRKKRDRDWLARCAAAHPSFDARTGTYLGQDGFRRYCSR